MLHLFFAIVGILITIFFVIGTHELGHFLVARLLNVKVLRFSIGFGNILFRFYDKKGTEYAFSAIPLGGYVKMLDENEGKVAPSELAFAYNRQPFYKKFLIVSAGPLTNLFCALILYWLIFMVGFVSVIPKIGHISSPSIAASAGLKANQQFISIDHRTTETWANVIFRLLSRAGDDDPVPVTVMNKTTNREENVLLDLSNWQIRGLTPDPLGTLGIIPYQPSIPLTIGSIANESPAFHAKLKVGDKITAIDKKATMNWEEVLKTISQNPNKTLLFTVKRKKETLHIQVSLGSKRELFFKKTGYLGVSPDIQIPNDLFHKIQYPPGTALVAAWDETRNISYFNLLLFKKLLTGDLSLETLGGPITIFESAGTALNVGLISFLGFLAFLSISIGIINLFPIPGLDGGHLFIQMIEALIGRPLPESILVNLYRVGFLFLFFILFQALLNDILRLY